MASGEQPEQLRRGKLFHDRMQKDWLANAQGRVKAERYVLQRDGRSGEWREVKALIRGAPGSCRQCESRNSSLS